MPDLGNFPPSSSSSLTLFRCPAVKPQPDEQSVETLVNGFGRGASREDGVGEAPKGPKVVRARTSKETASVSAKSMEDHVKDWVRRKVESGADKSRCFLPFLVGAKKMGECLVCHYPVCPEEELLCSVRDCGGVYHRTCATNSFRFLNAKKFRCPQHECFVCKQKFQWRCVHCSMASHDKCAPWPDKVIHFKSQPGRAVCWRHPTDWRLQMKHDVPTHDIEEVFYHLPLPYINEDFKFDSMWIDSKDGTAGPPPYVHIRRNVYLVKKRRDDVDFDVGCVHCTPKCGQDCVCRVQCISCSKACRCSDDCSNRPFRKEKKIKIVKTEFCGWGVEAAEPINKHDFVIEYIGEVIDDRLCEERLWDMKYRGVHDFYMCEIRKDFTIDATFKGNTSRFLNHSCDPNCILEKWQVEGETRVGVFAARDIEIGEPLTYDYRFVQFGPEVKCYCGAAKCQGYLGTKKKLSRDEKQCCILPPHRGMGRFIKYIIHRQKMNHKIDNLLP